MANTFDKQLYDSVNDEWDRVYQRLKERNLTEDRLRAKLRDLANICLSIARFANSPAHLKRLYETLAILDSTE